MTDVLNINDAFIDLFRELIHEKLGIYISREKDYLIQSKIGKLLNHSHYTNVAEFYYDLKHGNTYSFDQLIRFITTTHTFFFREPSHLKILRNDILYRNIRHTLIWCAACSTGEEVYSIIIELVEHGITDFTIVATDLNRDVLVHLKKGCYDRDRCREIDPGLMQKYFREEKGSGGRRFMVREDLKKFIIVKKLNLVEPIKFEKQFDYVFCRNVLIYFDRETQNLVVDTLLSNLSDTGYLFVGHSESLLNMNIQLETVFTSVYNKKT